MNASGSVTGRRLTMSRPTGTSYCSDFPRSPRSAPVSHSAYWTAIGRFSPIASRRRAAASGLPSGPMMISAGSPGSTRTTTNTSSETTRRVTTKAAARLAMYPRTSLGQDPGYFAHETSERSTAGSGRSFQSPCRPFLVTASRGWM